MFVAYTVAGEVSERTESRCSDFLGSGPLHDGGKRQITLHLKAGYKNPFSQFLKTEDLVGSFSPYVYLLCSAEKSRLFSILTIVKIISYNRFVVSNAPWKLIYVDLGR